MKLIIHRGAHQVGGSCIEISTPGTRLILDVGLPLEEPSLNEKRPRQNLAGLLKVPGLFVEGPQVDAVVISHAHSDHTGMLPFVNPEIPVYCSKGTSKMLMAGAIFVKPVGPDRKREKNLQPRKPIRIGDVTVTAFPVDHSAFDSLAVLVEAGDRRILYSGDLRLHGRKPGMARELIRHVRANPVDLLLMEGTNLRERPSVDAAGYSSEMALEAALRKEIQNWKQLVLANFSPQHVDRMVSFYKATRAAGRIFVLDVYGAFVWHLASGQCRLPTPTERNGIRVFYNQSFLRMWRRKKLKKIYDLFLETRIDLPAILAEPGRHTMLFRPSMLDLDFDGTLPARTQCLYSLWKGYLKRAEYQNLRRALESAEGTLTECHTSGHIFAEDIVKFVKAIDPHRVVPVHTSEPKRFQELFPNARLLPDGEAFYL